MSATLRQRAAVALALTLAFAVSLPRAGRAASAPSLSIRTAVELRLATEIGYGYQLQSASAPGTWTDFAAPFLAQAGAQSLLLPAGADGSQFYRVDQFPVRDLAAELTPIRSQYTVPALGCAVVRSNHIVALGVVGVRKQGISEPVTPQDKWHHGSLTKSMTATLAAMLVDAGVVRWDTKLADVFRTEAASMHADWKTVTLEQLLSNRSGAPEDLNPSGIWTQLWNHPGTPREQRRFLLQKLTVLAPMSKPGTTYLYSNAGFALAGAMLEELTGVPWEELITRRLFLPLSMTSAGFGVPATPRYIDQPWGHTFSGTTAVPFEPGTAADNPPGIGPAGTVHCSLSDLARYAAFHVAGERGTANLITTANFRKLHADVAGQGYGLGWSVTERPWGGGGKVLNHTGSNTQWYSNIWLAPQRDFAVVIVTNAGGDRAYQATDAVAGKMIQLFLN